MHKILPNDPYFFRLIVAKSGDYNKKLAVYSIETN